MLKLKQKIGGMSVVMALLAFAGLFILLFAFVTKNDEGRKLVSKVGEFIPADIVKPKTAA